MRTSLLSFRGICRISLFSATIALPASLACADDAEAAAIAWGKPVGGLQVGIACKTLETPANLQPVFAIYFKNCTDHDLTLPTIESFTKVKHPYFDDFFAQPLVPEVTELEGAKSTYSMGGGTLRTEARSNVMVLRGDQVRAFSGVALSSESYRVDQDDYHGKTARKRLYLLPNSTYRVVFGFRNTQPEIAGAPVWTGKATSGAVEIKVLPAVLPGARLTGEFTLPKHTFFLGEPIYATFRVTNQGEKPIGFRTGGDIEISERHERFSFVAVDEKGNPVRDPFKRRGSSAGGLGGGATVAPGQSYEEKLLVNLWCSFSEPGRYSITGARKVNFDTNPEMGSIEAILPEVVVETTLQVDLVRDDEALAEHVARIAAALRAGKDVNHPEILALVVTQCQPLLSVLAEVASAPGHNQAQAVLWIAQYDREKALPALLAAAQSADATARMAALQCLAKLAAEGTGDMVSLALKSDDARERAQAVLLCSQYRYPQCSETLLAMGEDKDRLVRRYLGSALGAYGDERAIPVLLRLLSDEDPDRFIRIWAAGGLGDLHRKDGVPVMIDLLDWSEQHRCSGNVIEVLRQLTGQDLGPGIRAWQRWWEKEGRAEYH